MAATESGTLRLVEGFETPDRARWQALVEKALKGAAVEDALTTTTHDGIAIAPLYSRDEAEGLDPGLPGLPPFTRHARAAGSVVRGWDIRPLHAHPDPAEANAQIREDLGGGATSILLRLDDALAAGDERPNGTIVYDRGDLATLLDGVDPTAVPIMVDAGARFEAVADDLLADLEAAGHDPARLPVDLGADPLAAVATGRADPADALDAVLRAGRIALGGSSLRVDGELYHAAGASEAQEIAAAIATAIQYLRTLVEGGMPVADAAGRILFTLAADADIFLTLAKFRAARRLWSQVLAHANGGAAAPAMRLHALTATRMLTERDPWTNLLRTSIAAFAAGIAGADSLTVLPFDHALGLSDARSRRLARNIPLILMAESRLHRVVDPAGGSHHIEKLTDDLARAAWPIVQAIEGEGGMLSGLRQGMIQDSIAATFMARLDDIATRGTPITGVSDFPDMAEPRPAPAEPDVSALTERARARLAPLPAFEPIAAPLRPMRLAQGFERLRDISDNALASHGARPRVLLVTLGTPAAFSERAAFARNAFAAGGIETVEPGALDGVEAAVAAFEAAACRVVCLCAPDERYAREAAALSTALRERAADAVLAVGWPDPALEAAGIDRFLFAGCNLMAVLEDTLSLILERPASAEDAA